MAESRRRLVSVLREELGESLRTVAFGDLAAREFDVEYITPEVGAKYDEAERERIFRDAVFEYLGGVSQEDMFEPLGELESAVRVFADGINVVAWDEDRVVFVGLDRSLDAVPVVVEEARGYLEE